MDKYQISDGYNSKDLAINWECLPEKIINNISGDYFYGIFAYSGDESINNMTVVYFRKVSKFRKGIIAIEHEGIEFGVE